MVKILFKYDISLDEEDHDGFTPLLYACTSGEFNIVKYLCKNYVINTVINIFLI